MPTTSERGKIVPNYVSVKVCDELYELIAKEADRQGCPMIEIVVAAVAKQFKRPDLAYVPRKPMGRPRQKSLALPK